MLDNYNIIAISWLLASLYMFVKIIIMSMIYHKINTKDKNIITII